jgi:hypothetical protein
MDRDYLSVDDLSTDELAWLLDLSGKVKAQPGDHAVALSGRAIALIFESGTGELCLTPVPADFIIKPDIRRRNSALFTDYIFDFLTYGINLIVASATRFI